MLELLIFENAKFVKIKELGKYKLLLMTKINVFFIGNSGFVYF